MEQNPFTFLNQAIGQLLATNSPAIQTIGLDMFRGLAVIMIAWFGIQNALSTAQGFYGSFHFGQFANLLLAISFGLGMLTYYSSPIPGMGYSFSDLITQEALQLSGQIESNQTQVIADAVNGKQKTQVKRRNWEVRASLVKKLARPQHSETDTESISEEDAA